MCPRVMRMRSGDGSTMRKELNSLYRSLNKDRVIKSRRLRWVEHVARMKVGRSVFKIIRGKPTGIRLIGKPSRSRRTFSEWILN